MRSLESTRQGDQVLNLGLGSRPLWALGGDVLIALPICSGMRSRGVGRARLVLLAILHCSISPNCKVTAKPLGTQT
jgi:hypothetical protein